MDDGRLISCKTAAALLGVSPATVTRWARSGRLRPVRTLGGHGRYVREVIEQVVRDLGMLRRLEQEEGRGHDGKA